MADAKKIMDPNEELVEIKLPRKEGEDQTYVQVNFKAFLIKRGEYVKVPKYVAAAIRDSEDAEDMAVRDLEEREAALARKAANPLEG